MEIGWLFFISSLFGLVFFEFELDFSNQERAYEETHFFNTNNHV